MHGHDRSSTTQMLDQYILLHACVWQTVSTSKSSSNLIPDSCHGFRHSCHVRLRAFCSIACACVVEASCHDIITVLQHAIAQCAILYIVLASSSSSSIFHRDNTFQLISHYLQYPTSQFPSASMRFQLLATLCSLFLLALAGLQDNRYIKGEIDFVNFVEDAKDFNRLNRVFLPNATYTIFEEDVQVDFVRGIVPIKASISRFLYPGTVTQSASTTQLIELDYPFDPIGSAATANATTYVTITFFGRGNQSGLTKSYFGVYQDRFVKTGNFEVFGGWKFSSRVFTTFVSFFPAFNLYSGQTKISPLLPLSPRPPSLPPLLPFATITPFCLG